MYQYRMPPNKPIAKILRFIDQVEEFSRVDRFVALGSLTQLICPAYNMRTKREAIPEFVDEGRQRIAVLCPEAPPFRRSEEAIL